LRYLPGKKIKVKLSLLTKIAVKASPLKKIRVEMYPLKKLIRVEVWSPY